MTIATCTKANGAVRRTARSRAVEHATKAQRAARGRAARAEVPRSSHAGWVMPSVRAISREVPSALDQPPLPDESRSSFGAVRSCGSHASNAMASYDTMSAAGWWRITSLQSGHVESDTTWVPHKRIVRRRSNGPLLWKMDPFDD